MYDDHMYCDVCDKHDLDCWCFGHRGPDPEDDVVCEGHGE